MDSLAESKWIKSLKFSSLHTAGVFNTTTTTITTTPGCTTTTTTTKISKKTANIFIPNTIATKDFSFNANPQRKTNLLLRNIWRNIQHYITTIARLFFYVFLILGLTDGFNLSTVLAISEHKSRSDFINISTTSSSLSSSTAALLTVLSSSAQQLPIEALILVANSNTAADVPNNSNSKFSQTTATTTTTTTRTTANNGFNSYQRHNNSMHDNNNNSINIYNADKTAAWATFSNSNTLNSITSTLSSLSGTFTSTTTSSSSSLLSSSSSSSSIFMYNDNTSATSIFPATFDAAVPPASPSNTTPTDEEFTTPAVHTVLVSIVLLFVILGTIVGNVLVCIAVCMVRKLRRPCNYLLVSLALSDLCVAVLVMPMALLYEVLEKWNFGPVLCDIWVSFDVLCCTASILNLCAISVDRYLAITKPLEYGVKRTPRRMMLCVALVWLAAACISLPPLLILGNEHVDENGNPMCSVCQNFAYQIYATLGSFYIPLAVMLFVYYQIFRAARRIVLEEKRAQTHLQHALNGTGSPPGHTELGGGGGNGQQHRHSSYGNTSLNYSNCGVLSTSQASGAGGGSGSSGLLGSPHQKKLRFQLAKEKKASTTLGIIMSAFTICWLPFFILALIRPFVESETTHVPQSLSSLFLWLGYANSLLNPIIYATLNRDFRKPFQEILYFRCSSLNTMMRENYYQDQYGEPPSQRVMLGDERHGARESFL